MLVIVIYVRLTEEVTWVMSGFVECFLIFCITITAIIAIVYDKNIKFKNRKSLDNIDEISVTLESHEEKKTKK